ncbi:hypothetical protein V1281_002606 [Nitrobacteraceae bacterium AZCC 2161]
MSEPHRLESRPERLWREFCEARDRAMVAGPRDMEISFAAGRAWGQFLAEFVADQPLRQSIHGKSPKHP